jgi:serine/threonine-protein kinase
MARETLLNNRYRLLGQQGAGGMAVIYKAQDVALGRIVAVKILRPSLTSDESFLQRFRNEARSAANLAHPNIVTVHDFGQDGDTHYMVMEFVDGTDLKHLVRADAPFPIDRALDLAIQICAGVGYAHRAGLVHADVKPQNVLVTDEDIVKVTDFGIARALAAQMPTQLSVVWGSPHYFAPEQARGTPPSPAADVYAIGVVIFEMLTGKLPYGGKDHQELALAHIKEDVPLISDVRPEVPLKLSRIIRKVMAKEPAARYRTADQLKRILQAYRDQAYQTTDKGAQLAPSKNDALPPEPPDVLPTVVAEPRQQPAQQPPVQVRVLPQPPTQPPSQQDPPPSAQPTYQQPTYQQPTQPPPSAPPMDTPPYRRDTAPYQPSAGGSFDQYVPTASPAQPPFQGMDAPREVDWIGLVLGIIALIHVLGLIPLGLRLYHLYVGGG